MAHVVAMIMAAGSGERFGGGAPKQLVPLAGRPALAWSIQRFAAHERVSGIVLVLPPGEEAAMRDALSEHGIDRVNAVTAGGETRQESVWLGLQALPENATHVLVHDAARACVTEALVTRIIDKLTDAAAVVPAVPAVDTLILEREGTVDAILDRVGVSGVQTPQAFERELLLRAHRHARSNGYRSSDDGSLVLALGEAVAVVSGERTNIKITYPEDVAIAEAILASTT